MMSVNESELNQRRVDTDEEIQKEFTRKQRRAKLKYFP